jgi:hypothetical protein
MAAVKGTPGQPIKLWGNERQVIRIKYDFAKDGGAVGALDLFEAGEAMIVMDCMVVAKTSLGSTGSATVSVGKAGDLAGIVAATAITDLEAGEVAFPAARDASHVIAAGAKVQMDIATEALNAGALEFVFELQKA